MQDQQVLPNKIGSPGRQRYKKDIRIERTVLVPRAQGMHSGHRAGVATVQSSYSFICCSGMQTERTRCGE